MATGATASMTDRSENSILRWLLANPVLAAGIASIVIPSMLYVARVSWSTEQGAHGPIVLATGLWLLAREWQAARPLFKPASAKLVILLFVPAMILYFIARVSMIAELEGYFMYGLLVVALFSAVGFKAIKVMWFPLFYLLFAFPPPETVVAITTNPLKIALSNWATNALYLAGYPIARAGVTLQVGQYQLLVADACSGLNSLISLSAIALFYVYLRHNANFRYAFVLFLTVVPVAIFANFMRIIFLVLLTYHGGESAAQGFLHDFAGMTTFVTALITIFLIDHLLGLVWPRARNGRDPNGGHDRPLASSEAQG